MTVLFVGSFFLKTYFPRRALKRTPRGLGFRVYIYIIYCILELLFLRKNTTEMNNIGANGGAEGGAQGGAEVGPGGGSPLHRSSKLAAKDCQRRMRRGVRRWVRCESKARKRGAEGDARGMQPGDLGRG